MIAIISMLTAKACAMIWKNKFQSGIREPDAPIGTAVSAMLALLFFMLGFTFSITANRKNLVIKKANTNGTSYLRTSILPAKQQTEIRRWK